MRKALVFLLKAIKKVLFILMIVLIVSVTLQVLSRYVLPYPFTWTQDVVRVSLTWLVMLSLPVGYYNNQLAGIDFVVTRICRNHPKVLHVFNIFTNLLVLFFSYVFIRYGLIFAIKQARFAMVGIPISYQWVYIAFPVSGILLAVVCCFQLYENISGLTGNKRDEALKPEA